MENHKEYWINAARELILEPKKMKFFIESFGRELSKTSPMLSEWWFSLSPMEQTLGVITMFKENGDKNLPPPDLTETEENSTDILPNKNET